jgi:hypothetical protein
MKWVGMEAERGEKGRCPLCKEGEDAARILLKCSETRKCWEQVLRINGLFLLKSQSARE